MRRPEAGMNPHEHVPVERRERPSRIAIARDVAIILVCVAFLLGALADVLLRARDAPAPRPAAPASSVAL